MRPSKWSVMLVAVVIAIVAGWYFIQTRFFINPKLTLDFELNEKAAYAELLELVARDAEALRQDDPGTAEVRYSIWYQFQNYADGRSIDGAEGLGPYLPTRVTYLGEHKDRPVPLEKEMLACLKKIEEKHELPFCPELVDVYPDQVDFFTDTAGNIVFYTRDQRALPRFFGEWGVPSNFILYRLCDHWYYACVTR